MSETLTPSDVLAVAQQVAYAMTARLETTGCDDTDVLALDEPLLAHLAARSVEGRDV